MIKMTKYHETRERWDDICLLKKYTNVHVKSVCYLKPFDSGAKCDHPKRGGSDTESASAQHIEIIIGDEQEFKIVFN